MNRPPVSLATAKSTTAMGVNKQIAAYAFVGVVFPAVAWSLARGTPIAETDTLRTIVQVVAANLACWYTISRLRTYARARLLSYVLPVNLVIFGFCFAANGLLRADLSFSLLLLCGLSTLFVSYLVTAKVRHANPQSQHYVVPGGKIGTILGQQGFAPAISIEHLSGLIEANAVTGSIVADLHHDHSPEWERLLAKAALKGIPVYHYRLIEEMLTGEVRISHLHENDLGSLIPNLPYRTVKRTIDIAGVVVISPFILLLTAICAVLIKLDSPGSVFFYQNRIGFRGENFKMVKFRTMRTRDAEDDLDARREDVMTKADDDRITRVGKFLRMSRMDEIPQAWNILLGQMSWIGPRPEARELAEWYESKIPFYSYRHIVRPGITGWAQINQGHVTDLDSIKGKLRFDFYYVKNLSLWLDILIGLKTLRVILSGIGAK